MADPMAPLPGLSPVSGKTIVVKFDGGRLSSDGGILVLREVEQRLRVADRVAASARINWSFRIACQPAIPLSRASWASRLLLQSFSTSPLITVPLRHPPPCQAGHREG